MEISYKDCEFDKAENCWIVKPRSNFKISINSYPNFIIVTGQTGLRIAYYHREIAMHNLTHRYWPDTQDHVKAKHTGLILQM